MLVENEMGKMDKNGQNFGRLPKFCPRHFLSIDIFHFIFHFSPANILQSDVQIIDSFSEERVKNVAMRNSWNEPSTRAKAEVFLANPPSNDDRSPWTISEVIHNRNKSQLQLAMKRYAETDAHIQIYREEHSLLYKPADPPE